MTAAATGRAIYLTREGEVFRLSFRFHPTILEHVKALPHAAFDPASRTWTAAVCAQSVQTLRAWYLAGRVDVPVDDLLAPGEDPAPAAPATLRAGPGRRPYAVSIAVRGDNTFDRLKKLPGASWNKRAAALTYPGAAAAALAELVKRGVLADPEKLLSPHEMTIIFDTRTGDFTFHGADQRAAAAFEHHFPASDVVAAWQSKGLDVGFLDDFTTAMYAGELARVGPGLQPEGLRVDLYPFQRANVAAAIEREGFAIFDGPGLGKTIQGVAVGHHLLQVGAVTRVVAIVPASVRTQWAGEISRFTGAGSKDVVVIDGDLKKRKLAYNAAKLSRWVLVHYDVLARDQELMASLFDGALVIADEAHRLKTYTAKRTIAALELSSRAARRLALTGTPTERDVTEWYQVLSGFTCPGVLGSPDDYNTRYRYPATFGYEGSRNLPELRHRSRLYYGRHTKEQVAAHLPPLQVQQVVLDPDPAYAAALRRAHREAANELRTAAHERLGRGHAGTVLLEQSAADEVATGAEMTAVGMLRMLCSSPRLIAASDSAAAAVIREAGLVPDEDGPKLDELRVMLAEFNAAQTVRKEAMAREGITRVTPEMVHGERVVIFTFSKVMADLICERMVEDGISHVKYTGDTSRTERDAAQAAFIDPSSDVIAFVATDAAAEGLNLGRCCSTLIQFDPAWTASRATQRANRIHRIDGTAPSYRVINFVVAGTMEHGVVRLLEQRADMSDALFGEEGSRAQVSGKRTKASARSLVEEALGQWDLDNPASTRERRTAAAAAGGVSASTREPDRAPAAAPAHTDAPAGEAEQLTLLG